MLISPVRLPGLFYRAFIRDFVRIFRVLSPKERLKFYLVIAMQFLVGLTETLTLLVISLFAVAVATPEAVTKSFAIAKLLEIFPTLTSIFTDPRALVGAVSAIMIGMVLIKSLVNLMTIKIVSKFVESCNKTITLEVVRHFINRDYHWHMTEDSQTAILGIFDRYYLVSFINATLNLYGNVITCLILFVSLSILEPLLTIVVVLAFGLSGLFLYGSVRLKLDKASKAVFESDLESRKVLVNLQKAMREIVIHRHQKESIKHYESVLQKSFRPRAFIAFSSYIPSQVLEFVGFATIGIMVIVMLKTGLAMDEIVSTASILMLTAWRILPSVNRALAYSVQIRGVRANSIVFLDLLEAFKRDKDAPIPNPDPSFEFTKSLELKNADFFYPDSEKAALTDIRLSIKKGENVGIIGPSGSGKSTLALLLTGLVNPSHGDFMVDGKNLTPESREAYFDILGYVSQTPLILDGSLGANISFQEQGETLDRDWLMECARMAALDFIDELPLGMDTELTSAAQTLSGGQIQRIAIARALYHKPEVLVFDEATSSLDLVSELTIQKTIRALKGQSTSIIIAHRLSTVETCDRLIWLSDGRIHQEGPPSEILPTYIRELKEREAGL
ncbi:MAG: ABC transporter ATP-binding protein/permease [Deltaproteobacteria bacterium]|jgi:ABC-type bacteriocin/lantibiotic exporter with double-glycine peptidase domain|nr:ABC transporter ATP-binding protein/permease [Deltaproteobacteria bacterium]